MLTPTLTDPTFSLHVVTGGRLSNGETRDKGSPQESRLESGAQEPDSGCSDGAPFSIVGEFEPKACSF